MAGTVLFAGTTETATLSVTFTVNGTPTDPTTVSLTVVDPLGASTVYTYPSGITKASTGNYWAAVTTPTAGEWSYTWTGTGTVPDVQHGSFSVLETGLRQLYATPQMIRSRVGLAATDTSFDLELQTACYAASRSLEQFCGRRFWRGAAETRVFEARSLYRVDLGAFNDLASAPTAVATDYDGDGVFDTTWTLGTDYELRPENQFAGPEQQPYTALAVIGGKVLPYVWSYPGGPVGRRARVQVTGVYGWPAVPEAIREAARMLAAQLFRMRDAPLGVASFGDVGVARVRANPLVAELAGPYRHPAVILA